MDDTETFTPIQTPTARRPLLGLTILVVEDSRFACETMRLMCLRSGARIRRADCLRSARRHLKVYRPSVVIVDMGLPDGSGVDLIEELTRALPRVGIILGLSGDAGTEAAAMAAGADGFLEKPLASLAAFQQAILAAMPPDRRPIGPRAITDDAVEPDPMAYRDDMNHVANPLDDHREGPVLDYVAQFLSGVARSARDMQLADAASELAAQRAQGRATRDAVSDLIAMVQERLTRQAAI
jgi:DNA-binding NarL/FixJ family response regulator